MEIIRFNHINEVPADEWDSCVSEYQLFHQHRFLKALDNASVEDAEMQYLMVRDDDRTIATCVLSQFVLNLDLFLGDSSLVQWIKRLMPSFFKISVLFCGTPVSAGHHNLVIEDPAYREAVTKLIAAFIDDYCLQYRIRYSIFKEFDDETVDKFIILEKFNYFKSYSLPNTVMKFNYDSYQEYLKDLRHTYRRQIKHALSTIDSTEPVFVEDYYNGNCDEAHPVFTFLQPSQRNAEEFYRLYLMVMERAESKLEVLNRKFFKNLFHEMNGELKLQAMVYRGKVLGVFLLTIVKEELTFVFTGKEKGKDQYNTYVNMLNAMVYYAIENNITTIIMGQTSYYPKQRFGGRIVNLFIYFKAHLRWKHRLLKWLSPVIFPRTNLPQLKVFKSNG